MGAFAVAVAVFVLLGGGCLGGDALAHETDGQRIHELRFVLVAMQVQVDNLAREIRELLAEKAQLHKLLREQDDALKGLAKASMLEVAGLKEQLAAKDAQLGLATEHVSILLRERNAESNTAEKALVVQRAASRTSTLEFVHSLEQMAGYVMVKPKPVDIILKLSLDFSSAGAAGSKEREEFERELAQNLSHASGLPIWQVANFKVKHMSPGSILVDTEIKSDVTENFPDPKSVAMDLERQVRDVYSPLRSGTITRFVQSITIPGLQPTPTAQPHARKHIVDRLHATENEQPGEEPNMNREEARDGLRQPSQSREEPNLNRDEMPDARAKDNGDQPATRPSYQDPPVSSLLRILEAGLDASPPSQCHDCKDKDAMIRSLESAINELKLQLVRAEIAHAHGPLLSSRPGEHAVEARDGLRRPSQSRGEPNLNRDETRDGSQQPVHHPALPQREEESRALDEQQSKTMMILDLAYSAMETLLHAAEDIISVGDVNRADRLRRLSAQLEKHTLKWAQKWENIENNDGSDNDDPQNEVQRPSRYDFMGGQEDLPVVTVEEVHPSPPPNLVEWEQGSRRREAKFELELELELFEVLVAVAREIESLTAENKTLYADMASMKITVHNYKLIHGRSGGDEDAYAELDSTRQRDNERARRARAGGEGMGAGSRGGERVANDALTLEEFPRYI